jgi:murein DD-endopeptidase MepM/ murein hydrolase activator NlpD
VANVWEQDDGPAQIRHGIALAKGRHKIAMAKRPIERVRETLDRLYPERQFYYRSNGIVRFITMGQISQMVTTGLVLALAGWLTFTTVHVVLKDQIIEAKNNRIDEITSAYQVLAERTVAGEERLLALTGEVQSQHSQLLELVNFTATLEGQLGAVTGQLEHVTGQRDQALNLTGELRDRVSVLRADLETTTAATQSLADTLTLTQTNVTDLTIARDQALAANDALTRQTAALTQTVGVARTRELDLTETLEQLQADLDAVGTQRDQGRDTINALTVQTADLEGVAGDARAAENNLIQVLGETQTELAAIVAQRDQAQGEILALTARTDTLEIALGDARSLEQNLTVQLAEIQDGLAATKLQRDTALAGGDELADQVADLTFRIDDFNARSETVFGDLAAAQNRALLLDAERADAVARNQAMAAQVVELTQRLRASTGQTGDLVDHLAAAEDQAARMSLQRDEALASRDFTARLVDELEYQLTALRESQDDLVRRLQVRTGETVADVEEMIVATGLDIDQLLAAAPDEFLAARGGPFVALERSADGPGAAAFAQSVFAVETQLERWNLLEEVLGIIPLTSPIDSYYISSQFGMRRDPFNGQRAMHNGIDMAGQFKSPLYAPAPGVVTKAGTWGSYGRMVEIDHGFGLITRYGHMEEVQVNRGDVIGFRDQIGLMGRSGRSTGTHVHYEVLFNDIPQDPTKFIRAGQHVFKN